MGSYNRIVLVFHVGGMLECRKMRPLLSCRVSSLYNVSDYAFNPSCHTGASDSRSKMDGKCIINERSARISPL